MRTKTKVVPLSPREREVILAASRDMNTDQIADYLGLAPGTIKVYKASVRKKLGCHTFSGAVGYAIREGLIT